MLSSPALALTLAAFFWAGSFVVGRGLRDEIDPVALTFFRWLVSLLIFVPFVWRELVAKFRIVLREWRLILGLGATGIALFHPLVYLALQHTSATNALLTFSLTPVVILICVAVASRTLPSRRELAGVAVSIAGACTLITRGDVAAAAASGINTGELWMLAAVAAWAAYSLFLRRRPSELSQTLVLASSIAAALPMLLPLMLLDAGVQIHVSASMLWGAAYIAVFGSVIGFLLWSHGVTRLGPTRAGQFVHLMPVFGAALSLTFLGEPLSMAQIFGAALVISGLLLIDTKRPAETPSQAR